MRQVYVFHTSREPKGFQPRPLSCYYAKKDFHSQGYLKVPDNC